MVDEVIEVGGLAKVGGFCVVFVIVLGRVDRLVIKRRVGVDNVDLATGRMGTIVQEGTLFTVTQRHLRRRLLLLLKYKCYNNHMKNDSPIKGADNCGCTFLRATAILKIFECIFATAN